MAERTVPQSRLVVGVVAGLFCTLLAACHGKPAPVGGLRTSSTPFGGVAQVAGRMPHASVWVGGICTDSGAPIGITRVEPVQATGGLRVNGFVVTPPNSVKAGFAAKKSLASLYPDLTSHEVRLPCSDDAEDPTVGAAREDLNLEISKPGSAPASAQRFRVFYEADGEEQSVDVRFSIYICERNLDSHACKAFSHTP